MDKNIALESLILLTNNNYGHVPTTPVEFNALCHDILQKTGKQISLSSIKRLWGYVKYDGFPSITTLNTLAHYNGFRDWETFRTKSSGKYLNQDSSFLNDSVINSEMLNIGDHLILSWSFDKQCEIECIAPSRFRIVATNNIKLQPDDTLTLHSVSVGLPLYITHIERNGLSLPAYIGAKKGGITSIEIIHLDED